ncbi:putative FmdB family regulatory protein [Pseudonocardia hierapolitana]|uniref:Putative FmdB family regulatory protein n=1 Tax=Pseudonocardia hierapolitana TaxID=1128676 RepID=A0A561T0Q5_9PSEU|nr:zinc ribbon domain-containing protein [Pseudonocardia hierapolitana]TWF80708.1 putative FmdB family regulatory protein [Pseudonocardia hierapolitana]
MPTYAFRCPRCGEFEVRRPMAESACDATCPDCALPATRVFGAPALRGLDPTVRRALDAGARSAESPQVVTSVPGRSRRATPLSTDPRHARLPRP